MPVFSQEVVSDKYVPDGTGTASCGYEDIQYPASFVLPEYCESEGLGVLHGTSQIEAYAKACPDSQLVLSGYSQVSNHLLLPYPGSYP